MVSDAIAESVVREMDRMPLELQRRVLDFAHALAGSSPRGTPGKALLEFAGSFSSEDLSEISAAVEDGCERVDADAW